MNAIETKMVEYIKKRQEEGALAVSESEIMGAVVSSPHDLFRPAFRYGLRRLCVRHVINRAESKSGQSFYFIGNHASIELRKWLSELPNDPAAP